MEDDNEKGTVHVQLAVTVNDASFAELVHEETDAEPHDADHVVQHVLTDLRKGRLRLPSFLNWANNRSRAPGESPEQ